MIVLAVEQAPREIVASEVLRVGRHVEERNELEQGAWQGRIQKFGGGGGRGFLFRILSRLFDLPSIASFKLACLSSYIFVFIVEL